MTNRLSVTRPAFIGWTRDDRGNIQRYNVKSYCNAITTFSGGVSVRIKTQECI